MSNESTATKWVVGCLVAGVLCLFACGGAMVWMYSAAMRAGRAVTQQAQVMQQASNWNLPEGWAAPDEGAPDDTLLPLQAREWERMFVSEESTIPVVDINRDNVTAVYAADGHSLDVYVARVDGNERDAVFDQAKDVITSNSTGHSTIGSGNGTTKTFFYQTFGGSGSAGWMVWNDGWLFVIQSSESEAPLADFMTVYFEEIDARPSPDDVRNLKNAPEGDDPDGAEPIPEDAADGSTEAATTAADDAAP
jgi:hypothetical protein